MKYIFIFIFLVLAIFSAVDVLADEPQQLSVKDLIQSGEIFEFQCKYVERVDLMPGEFFNTG